MTTAHPTTDPLAALRHLTLAQVAQRLADLDAERASLQMLRRALAARERALRRGAGGAAETPHRQAAIPA